jgi:hypothetical protein
MFSIAKRRAVNFRIRSEIFTLPVHFTTRTLVCSQGECPVCPYERNRYRSYFAIECQNHVDVIEAPPTLIHTVDEKIIEHRLQTPVGLCLSLERSSNRRPWKCNASKLSQCPGIDESFLVENVAVMFRITLPAELPSWKEFRKLAAAAHRPFLAKSVLPFVDPLLA